MKPYRLLLACSALAYALAGHPLTGLSEQTPASKPAGGPFDSLHFRSIGPATMSGRIADIAVFEANPAIYDMATPFNVCGGMQVNYSWCGPSAVRSTPGIGNHDWKTLQGGDGFVVLLASPRTAGTGIRRSSCQRTIRR
jgi:hypothetical protein